MSVGKFLLTAENLEIVRKNSWKFGRPRIIDAAMRYYDGHPEEVARIAENLAYIGLPADVPAIESVKREIAAHYYEKLFALVKSYEAYWIAKNRIEVGDSLAPFVEARESGRAVFVAQSHFGATYLMALVLMVNGFDIHVVGSFPEPVGPMLRRTNAEVAERYKTGKTELINLAEPGTDAPFAMMRLFATGRIVSNVFDESNAFCKPVDLLGRKVMGGTGMDKILRAYTDEKVICVTPFLIRTSDETFRYELDRHSLGGGDIIASFYRSLEKRIRAYPAQWYFIQELHRSFVNGDVQG